MNRRKRFLFGLSAPLLLSGLLLTALGACRQNPVVPPPDPLNFGTDPGILRGRWEGVGVSDRYRAATFGLDGALFGAGTSGRVQGLGDGQRQRALYPAVGAPGSRRF